MATVLTKFDQPVATPKETELEVFYKMFGRVSTTPWNVTESIRQKQLVPVKPPAVKTASVPGGPGQPGARKAATVSQIGSSAHATGLLGWLKEIFPVRGEPWWTKAWAIGAVKKVVAAPRTDTSKRPNTPTSGFGTKAHGQPEGPSDVVAVLTTPTINGPAHYVPTAGINGTVMDDSSARSLRKYIDDSYGPIFADTKAPAGGGKVGAAPTAATVQVAGPFPGPKAAASGTYVKPAQRWGNNNIHPRDDVPPGFEGAPTPFTDHRQYFA